MVKGTVAGLWRVKSVNSYVADKHNVKIYSQFCACVHTSAGIIQIPKRFFILQKETKFIKYKMYANYCTISSTTALLK